MIARPSRSVVLRTLVALAIGLSAPFLEVAWKCRAGHETTEACVWGRAYLPVSRTIGLILIAPIAFGVLTLVARLWRSRNRHARPSV